MKVVELGFAPGQSGSTISVLPFKLERLKCWLGFCFYFLNIYLLAAPGLICGYGIWLPNQGD